MYFNNSLVDTSNDHIKFLRPRYKNITDMCRGRRQRGGGGDEGDGMYNHPPRFLGMIFAYLLSHNDDNNSNK